MNIKQEINIVFKHNIVCFCSVLQMQIPIKATAELLRVS